MITVLTSHNHIWQIDQVVADIVKEYQEQGHAIISMNNEGPCADSVGLYKMLDSIVEKFKFEKNQITIKTCNREETHSEYNIVITKNRWAKLTYCNGVKKGFSDNMFDNKKNLINRFGCLYNIPSWNRLSLISHIRYNTSNNSILACNPTWTPHEYNSVYLNPVTDFCPEEFGNISRLLIDGIEPLPGHPGCKPDANENVNILCFYNDFFVDVVAETYTNGLTFFPTEKTFRPMFGFTPFIIFGPQNFLSTLKSDYNFKSFGNWWDESYDNYQNYDRIKQMYRVIDYIDSLSPDDVKTMYKEMRPVLEHNFKQLKNLALAQ